MRRQAPFASGWPPIRFKAVERTVPGALRKLPPLMLASASPRRAELLRGLGIEFQVLPANVPEIHHEQLTARELCQINAYRKARFVAKKELRDWPVAGFLVKNAGTLFIDRANRRDASRVNQQLATALQAGGCMAVFPEATTSDGRGLLPFKASLFEAARLAGATVQPVAIRFTTPGGQFCEAAAYAGDTTFWQSICQILRTRAMVVELHYTPAIRQADSSCQTRFALSDTSRRRIAEALHLPADA